MRFRFIAAALLFATASAPGIPREAEDIAHRLERIRDAHRIPALAGAAVDEGEIVAIGVTGSRRAGTGDAVFVDDIWHLGSCTKSMTASVCAMLVEDGKLRWNMTLGAVFPDLLDAMYPEWRAVTLEQLLVHRAGAPGEPPADLWKEANKRIGTPTEQRWNFAKGLLARKPAHPPGTHWEYSDSGYAIVGAVMERVTGMSWEDLMRTRLFIPLGLKSAGFGEPASPGLVNQPWGHRGEEHPFHAVPPGPFADNPPAIGPAATVHCSIGDFARYAAWQLAGDRGDGWLLTPESFQKLHTPPEDQEYAMGWAVTHRRWAGGVALMHNGENEMFYAVMWLGPGENTCFVAACNCDGPEAADACDEAIKMMINRF